MSEVSLETIVSLCKRRGFIYQGSEVYGGLAGTWDYGPLGVQLKWGIMSLWWEKFVGSRDNMYDVDASILMNPKVWDASGHLAGFKDPMVVCSNCHSQFRADHFLLDAIKNNQKSPNVVAHDQYTGTIDNMNSILDVFRPSIKCPHCGKSGTFGGVKQFLMMFKTHMGSVEGEGAEVFLRPETAQGIFTNYKNILDSFYPDIPFGIAQIGKAFRNEISPRDFVFRTREFEQMEIEYFIQPEGWEKAFEQWRKGIHEFLQELGLPKDKVHELEVPEEDRAHYSKRTIDFEFDYPHGRDELLGLAYRTDFDLQNIQKASGKNMEYRPKDNGKAFVPHVIEPSFGVERAVMAVLTAAYTEDEIGGEKRAYLKLPAKLAPVKAAVSPLLKNKPELVEKAREVYATLKKELGNVMYDDNGNIGKRYRRQDEIGTPYCVTIDFQTIDDNTVTIRDRDTAKQERVAASDLVKALRS